MQSNRIITPEVATFSMLVTLDREPREDGSTAPLRDHHFWTLEGMAPTSLTGWRLVGVQEDGAALDLPATAGLDGDVLTFSATSGKHKAPGSYREFRLFDGPRRIFTHVTPPLAVTVGQKLSVNFAIRFSMPGRSSKESMNGGVGAVAQVRVVETE